MRAYNGLSEVGGDALRGGAEGCGELRNLQQRLVRVVEVVSVHRSVSKWRPSSSRCFCRCSSFRSLAAAAAAAAAAAVAVSSAVGGLGDCGDGLGSSCCWHGSWRRCLELELEAEEGERGHCCGRGAAVQEEDAGAAAHHRPGAAGAASLGAGEEGDRRGEGTCEGGVRAKEGCRGGGGSEGSAEVLDLGEERKGGDSGGSERWETRREETEGRGAPDAKRVQLH